MKMHELGHKLKEDMEPKAPMTKSAANEMRYPSAYFDDKDMPLDKLEHGKTYRMNAVVHVKSKTVADENGKKSSNVRLEFHRAGFEPYKKKGAEDMSDSELENAKNDKMEDD